MASTLLNFGSVVITFTAGVTSTQLYRNNRNYFSLIIFSGSNALTNLNVIFSGVSLPTVGSFTLSQTFTIEFFGGCIFKRQLLLSITSINPLTSSTSTGFGNSFSDGLATTYLPNSGSNRFQMSFTGITFWTGVNLIQITLSAGKALQCFLSNYFCHVADNVINIRPINPSE